MSEQWEVKQDNPEDIGAFVYQDGQEIFACGSEDYGEALRFATQIVQCHNATVEDLRAEVARLRSFLTAWVTNERGPIEFDQCVYCDRMEWDGGHADDCPWLLARQEVESWKESGE